LGRLADGVAAIHERPQLLGRLPQRGVRKTVHDDAVHAGLELDGCAQLEGLLEDERLRQRDHHDRALRVS
jgi:hypothetical protein